MSDFYKYKGFWWKTNSVHDLHTGDSILGPFCINCYGDIGFPEDALIEVFGGDTDYSPEWVGEAACLNCDKQFKLTIPIPSLRDKVAQILKSNYRATLNKIALDEPVSQVKVRDEDDTYFLSAKIGQKDGKRVGVVYFGDKKKDQSKKDYSQMFVDLDEEQARFDKSNKHPLDLATSVTVEFPESTVKLETKSQRNKK